MIRSDAAGLAVIQQPDAVNPEAGVLLFHLRNGFVHKALDHFLFSCGPDVESDLAFVRNDVDGLSSLKDADVYGIAAHQRIRLDIIG